MRKRLPCLLIFSFTLLSCEGGETSQEAVPHASEQLAQVQHFGYALEQPAEIYRLPGSLKELSGMESLLTGEIACLQDEDGTLYLYNREQQQLSATIQWGGAGDYEGLAGNSDTLYVLQSDGQIFRLADFADGTPEVSKWNTGLGPACDAEGLLLLPLEQQLLIACKSGAEGMRAVWQFDLRSEQLRSKPYYQVAQKAIEEKLIHNDIDHFALGLRKLIDAKGESGIFAPSGIALHPKTNEFFIVSAESRLLTVLSSVGEVLYLKELPKSLFPQPESVTFTAEGDLLIGNEGKDGKATILLFTYEEEK